MSDVQAVENVSYVLFVGYLVHIDEQSLRTERVLALLWIRVLYSHLTAVYSTEVSRHCVHYNIMNRHTLVYKL